MIMDWTAILISVGALIGSALQLPFTIKTYRKQSQQIREAKLRAAERNARS